MNTPRFSIALIARNEAQSLPVLFGSLAEYLKRGGEVVIVDTGSDDDTAAVARTLGARVVEVGTRFHSILSQEQFQQIQETFAREGEELPLHAGQQWFDFARAREMATWQASQDFVLMPDAADEFLVFDIDWFDEQIQQQLASGFRYQLKLGTMSFSQSRFFDRRIYEWQGRTHEAIYNRTEQQTAILQTEAPPIWQSSPQQLCIRHHRGQKARPYMVGMALDLLEESDHPRWQHYLGREFFYYAKWHSAIALLERHAANQSGWVLEKNESLCLIGRCWEELKDKKAARHAYERAIELDGSRREPFLRLAQLYSDEGNFKQCAELAQSALKIEERGPFAEADENYTYLPHSLLYWSLFWQGQREDAHLHWHKCWELSPDNARFLTDARLFGVEERMTAEICTPFKLHILTRCTRPENLLTMKESIFPPAAEFEIVWHLLFDTSVLSEVSNDLLRELNQSGITHSFREGVKGDFGHNLLNQALDEIAEGWIYVLDDDNLMHEEFYSQISILVTRQNCRAVVFSQLVNGKDFSGLNVRQAGPENMKVQKIDMAQFLLHRSLIAGHRFALGDYKADGSFIEEIFADHKTEFIFSDQVLCYYNYLAKT